MLNNFDDFYNIVKILQPLATDIIALFAIFAFFNTRSLWRKTYRPIISVVVETYQSGNIATLYNLVVINSGNRPAVDIRLEIDDYEQFKKCITKDINDPNIEEIIRCFDKKEKISLLIDGEKIKNSFGVTSINEQDNIWKYGSSFPIKINYKDLEKRRYKSKLTLFIIDSKAFAGGSWLKSKDNLVDLLKKIIKEIEL